MFNFAIDILRLKTVVFNGALKSVSYSGKVKRDDLNKIKLSGEKRYGEPTGIPNTIVSK